MAKVVTAIVKTLEEANLDEDARAAIQQAAQLQSAGIDDEVMANLTQDVCRKMDIPLLSKAQKQAVVGQTLSLMLGDTTLLQLAAGGAATVHPSFGRMVVDPTSRRDLVTRLNTAVDIPGLSEEQEQVLFQAAIDMVGACIDKLVPEEWRHLLDGLDASEIRLLKETTTERLVEQVALPLPLSEGVVRQVVTATVDCLFRTLLDSEVGAATLSPRANLDRVRRIELEVKAEVAFLTRKAQRDQNAILRRQQALEAQKAALKNEIQRHWF